MVKFWEGTHSSWVIHSIAEAAVVCCDEVLSVAKFDVVVASSSEMSSYVGPGIGVVDVVSICMHIEGWFLDASLAFGFQHFNPHGFYEQFYQAHGVLAFTFFHCGKSILDELSCGVVAPYVLYALFNWFWGIGVEAFDGKEEGWAVHFRGDDSESYVLGCPDSLLCEDLVVDLAQVVDEEGGRKAFVHIIQQYMDHVYMKAHVQFCLYICKSPHWPTE